MEIEALLSKVRLLRVAPTQNTLGKRFKTMENIFQTGKKNFGSGERNFILILRKLSQIPIYIDRELMHGGACAHIDGPANRVTYEFFWEESFEKSKEYLLRCGWTEGKS